MVDHELDELKREFLAEADDKVREMRAALGLGGTPESLDRLVYLAHQLKGSGGSYGYSAISANAAEIEKSIEKIATGEAAFADVEHAVRQRLANLGSAIEKSTRELSAANA
jgi:HPt (histidine-containing phosphotransfer) domain-containing protein